MIPSTFLPPLPRPRIGEENKFPLPASELLAHIAILRELYIPPVHGGFLPDDSFDDDDDDVDVNSHKDVRIKKRDVKKKSTVAQISAGINGLGLGFGMVDDLSNRTTDGSGTNTPIAGQTTRDSDDDSDSGSVSGSDSEEEASPHLDPFEREWAEKWLGGLVRRSQGYLESQEEVEFQERNHEEVKEVEAVLRDATAVLAMMAGTSAAGSLTRHLVFPIADSLAPALKLLRSNTEPNPALSPQTNTFLASLSTSPTSPKTLRRPSISVSGQTRGRGRSESESVSIHSNLSMSPTTTNTSTSPQRHPHRHKHPRKKRAVIPILLHDAPMGDHLGVGMQTWGSAILLGRRLALRPEAFGLFPPISPASGSGGTTAKSGVRVLELGAGTGLLSILCRKLLDLHHVSDLSPSPSTSTPNGASEEQLPESRSGLGLVVATDFLPNVLDNLKICVDLNFPPHLAESGQIDTSTDINREEGIHIAKLDWTTFPTYMAGKSGKYNDKEELAPFVTPAHEEDQSQKSFDLVLASDCVYDETHAKLLRQVASWVLRLPDENDRNDIGGTFHILSPLRPTFGPELESTDIHFPNISTYLPLEQRAAAAVATSSEGEEIAGKLRGEGLGVARGLKLGTRGNGKKSVEHRRGEGRVDENGGYWWWEVGWG